MAELHILGQLVGASGFPSQDLFCKWSIVAGQNWSLLEGLIEGQTQVDVPKNGQMAIWAHPIDVHYATKGIQGWPKLKLQVWHQDMFGRNELYGYGFCHLPMSAGIFDLDCVTWRPQGSISDEITAFFLGGTPQLANDELVVSGADRYRLKTISMGTVHIHISIIHRDFAKYGISM
eukprot:Phypoly_transcript_21272.p1 GENE.Phypoly_transcript_21272~~Phypoly_transcript_21272.p1  ORF type:complete len:176 (+),score=17.78 Phypoly_transcript_21272:55-582(+)